jgi:hypothetical protein
MLSARSCAPLGLPAGRWKEEGAAGLGGSVRRRCGHPCPNPSHQGVRTHRSAAPEPLLSGSRLQPARRAGTGACQRPAGSRQDRPPSRQCRRLPHLHLPNIHSVPPWRTLPKPARATRRRRHRGAEGIRGGSAQRVCENAHPQQELLELALVRPALKTGQRRAAGLVSPHDACRACMAG